MDSDTDALGSGPQHPQSKIKLARLPPRVTAVLDHGPGPCFPGQFRANGVSHPSEPSPSHEI